MLHLCNSFNDYNTNIQIQYTLHNNNKKPGMESNFVQRRMAVKNNFYSFQYTFGTGCV